RAIELNDHDGWAWIYLANLLWRRRDFGPAEESFKKAVEVWPEIATAYWCLALFYQYQGRMAEAERLFRLGLEVDPDDPIAMRLLGRYLEKIGETEAAQPYLERARAMYPEDEDIEKVLASLAKASKR